MLRQVYNCHFFHNRVGSKKFLETILGRNKADAVTIKDPNNLAAIIQGFKFSSSNQHKAYFHDYRQTLPQSREMLIDLAFRTYAIIGTDDNNNRSERVEKLIKAGANLSIVNADGGGDMLFYSHPELIVETIQRAWTEAKAS